MKSVIRWFFRIVFSLFLVVAFTLAIILLFKIPINLTGFKEPVEALATKALGREVVVEDSIVISTSLSPVFTMKGLNIGNPEGFSQHSFLNLDEVRLQIDLLPLLGLKLHIPEISVQGLMVTLEENANQEVNWIFGQQGEQRKVATDAASTEKQPQDKVKVNKRPEVAGDSVVIEKLELNNIQVASFRPDQPEPGRLKLERCSGNMLPGQPLQLDMNGTLQTFPFTVAISVASLEEFLTKSTSWMDVKAEMARTLFTFSGNVDLEGKNRALALKTEVRGDNLQSLNSLLNVELPPFASYKVATDLEMRPGRFILNNLHVATGSSSLIGTAKVVKDGKAVTADLKLHAPLIQLDDLIFDQWSWTGEDEMAEAEQPVEGEEQEPENGKSDKQEIVQKEENGQRPRKLLDPDVLDDFDLQLQVKADQVVSGEDMLGKGLLEATLTGGRIEVKPLELRVPGGSISMAASLKPGKESSDATFRAVMDNFDIGILVRRTKPEAKMAGLVNLDVDLRSSAATPDEIFANGNGYFDFSGQLDNISAGIIDLWAVNLIAAIVSGTDENQSEINCAVGRWSVVDGILTPDVFVVDTSKIRICGKGQVDMGRQRLDITVSPTAKKPEFFNLATPIRVNGSFDEINFGVKRGAIVGTALKFITSPVHVPIRRMILKEAPEDGSDVCNIPLGPENRTPESIQGCR